MSDVYENCPAFENDKFLLRFSQLDDAEDLVSVYSDKNALPFFNSDNCHGDNFYYPNEDRDVYKRQYETYPWQQNHYSTRNQDINFELKPLYEVMDEAYTVYFTAKQDKSC